MKNTCMRLQLQNTEPQWVSMFVSDKRRYVYCAVPKVAYTSWMHTLLTLTGKMSPTRETVHKLKISDKIIKRAHYYTLVQRRQLLQKYYKFMFVREPMERLVSAYTDKVLHLGWDRLKSNLEDRIKRRRHTHAQRGKIAKKCITSFVTIKIKY